MSDLGERRKLFARLLPLLIDKAHEMGFDVMVGEVCRSQAAADWNAAHGLGISNSLHLVGLAVDLNLFRGDTYLVNSEDHRPLGVWWENLNALCRWGGRFTHPDGNHYSLTWDGRA